MSNRTMKVALSAAAVASTLVLAACGGSSSGGSSSSAAPASSSAAATSEAPASSSAPAETSAAAGANVEAAKALIAPIVGKPSAFPITEPLKASPAGKKIAFVDCGTPVCALFAQIAEGGAKAAGMEMTVVKAGFEPDKVQAAFDTILQD